MNRDSGSSFLISEDFSEGDNLSVTAMFFIFDLQTTWGLRLRDSVLWTVGKTKIYKMFQDGDGASFKDKVPNYDWVDA